MTRLIAHQKSALVCRNHILKTLATVHSECKCSERVRNISGADVGQLSTVPLIRLDCMAEDSSMMYQHASQSVSSRCISATVQNSRFQTSSPFSATEMPGVAWHASQHCIRQVSTQKMVSGAGLQQHWLGLQCYNTPKSPKRNGASKLAAAWMPRRHEAMVPPPLSSVVALLTIQCQARVQPAQVDTASVSCCNSPHTPSTTYSRDVPSTGFPISGRCEVDSRAPEFQASGGSPGQ